MAEREAIFSAETGKRLVESAQQTEEWQQRGFLQPRRYPKPVYGEGAAGGHRFAIIRNVYGGDADVCEVHEVRPRTDSDPEPEDREVDFVTTGDRMDIACWPNTPSQHYEVYKWDGAKIRRETQILPLVHLHNQWWIQQYMRWNLAIDPGSEWPFSDCTIREPE